MAVGGMCLSRRAAHSDRVKKKKFVFRIILWTTDHRVDSQFVTIRSRQRHFIKPEILVKHAKQLFGVSGAKWVLSGSVKVVI